MKLLKLMELIDWHGFLFRFGLRGTLLFAVDIWIRVILGAGLIYYLLIRSITRKPSTLSSDILLTGRIIILLLILSYIFSREGKILFDYITGIFI